MRYSHSTAGTYNILPGLLQMIIIAIGRKQISVILTSDLRAPKESVYISKLLEDYNHQHTLPLRLACWEMQFASSCRPDHVSWRSGEYTVSFDIHLAISWGRSSRGIICLSVSDIFVCGFFEDLSAPEIGLSKYLHSP